jgi:thymidylate synthase (FAD)
MKVSDIEVTYIDHMGTDLSIVNAARVSFDKTSEWEVASFEQNDVLDRYTYRLSERDAKLIHYLAKYKHTSPFNHCFATFRVKAPIFVARQLVKHKFMPWNEVSRRYVDSEPEFFLPEVWRKKADNVKQGSADAMIEEPWKATSWAKNVVKSALFAYNSLLSEGVCPEQARMVLPQNTMTEWIWSGTLGAWADMCRLRLDSHTQKETQCVATSVAHELRRLFPVGFKTLMEA